MTERELVRNVVESLDTTPDDWARDTYFVQAIRNKRNRIVIDVCGPSRGSVLDPLPIFLGFWSRRKVLKAVQRMALNRMDSVCTTSCDKERVQ